MTSPIGIQQNIFWYGVVEDRDDPLKLGRVKVRVVGIHSEDLGEVPTEDLPWAPVVLSSTNAGTSGLGWSPNGLVTGSWVVVYFADGSACQNPVVIGTLVGVNPTSLNTPSVPLQEVTNELKTEKQQESSNPLGWISEKEESGNKGVATISNGSGDAGGKSYGQFQLSSKSGTLQQYIKMSKYRSEFSGIELASNAFDAKWKEIANKYPAEFKEDNRAFIESSNFTPCSIKLQYLNLNDRHQAVSEMVWSYSVQYGALGGANKINRALNGQKVNDLSDADIIELCYNDRKQNVNVDFKSSSSLWTSLKARFDREKKACLDYCGQKPTGIKPIPVEKDAGGSIINSATKIDTSVSSKQYIRGSGFVDPNGKYPKKGYLGKTDTNRLSKVQETEKTIQRVKRLSLIKGNGFNEPYLFEPKYPYNKVMESESGHIIEIDDTPEKERVHVYHRSGSFIEFHPDGTIVKKSIKDNNEIVISNNSIYTFGNHSIFAEGNIDIKTLGNATIESEGNCIIRSAANLTIAAEGNIDIMAGGSINVGSSSNINMNAPKIKENNGSASVNVSVDIGAAIKLQKIPDIEDDGPIVDDYDTDSNSANQVFATKNEIDTAAGYSTEDGPKTTEAKQIDSIKENISSPDRSLIDNAVSLSPSTKLSTNFNLGDLTTSCVFKYPLQEQMGLTEKEIAKNLQDVAVNILEPIVNRYTRQAFIITCALRHAKGNSKSQHLKGMAVDIQFPGNAENIPHIAEEISKFLPAFDQLIVEYHSKNPVIHISYNATNNRSMKFTTFTPDFKGKTPLGFYDKNQNLIYPA